MLAFDMSHTEHFSGSANEIEALGAIAFRSSDGVVSWLNRLKIQIGSSVAGNMSTCFHSAPM